MAQSARHSRLEIGLDFCISIAINLGLQALFLRSFTLSRGLGFTGVFLVLALVRRYLVRRGFNRLVRPGRGQSRSMSLVETGTDTVLAMLMAIGLAVLWYPAEPLPKLSGVILVSYALTLVRRYVMRRLFEWLPGRFTVTEEC